MGDKCIPKNFHDHEWCYERHNLKKKTDFSNCITILDIVENCSKMQAQLQLHYGHRNIDKSHEMLRPRTHAHMLKIIFTNSYTITKN